MQFFSKTTAGLFPLACLFFVFFMINRPAADIKNALQNIAIILATGFCESYF
jgi:hypothetical protein